MISDTEFKQAAALLKRAAPADVWENFMGAFKAYTFTKIGEAVDAPAESVILAQGFARQCKKLLMLLEECDHVKGGQP